MVTRAGKRPPLVPYGMILGGQFQKNVAAYAKERMRGSESGYIRCCPASRSQSRSQAPDARLGLTGKETVKPW